MREYHEPNWLDKWFTIVKEAAIGMGIAALVGLYYYNMETKAQLEIGEMHFHQTNGAPAITTEQQYIKGWNVVGLSNKPGKKQAKYRLGLAVAAGYHCHRLRDIAIRQ